MEGQGGSENELLRLPEELANEWLSFVDGPELVRLAKCSKQSRVLAESVRSSLWEKFCMSHEETVEKLIAMQGQETPELSAGRVAQVAKKTLNCSWEEVFVRLYCFENCLCVHCFEPVAKPVSYSPAASE